MSIKELISKLSALSKEDQEKDAVVLFQVYNSYTGDESSDFAALDILDVQPSGNVVWLSSESLDAHSVLEA